MKVGLEDESSFEILDDDGRPIAHVTVFGRERMELQGSPTADDGPGPKVEQPDPVRDFAEAEAHKRRMFDPRPFEIGDKVKLRDNSRLRRGEAWEYKPARVTGLVEKEGEPLRMNVIFGGLTGFHEPFLLSELASEFEIVERMPE